MDKEFDKTLTEVELAAESFLDWDDETLGRAVRFMAKKIESHNTPGWDGITIMGACLLLIETARNANAGSLNLDIDKCTHKGISTGDWKITVKKKKDK